MSESKENICEDVPKPKSELTVVRVGRLMKGAIKETKKKGDRDETQKSRPLYKPRSRDEKYLLSPRCLRLPSPI
jgi:hypothetical protein